jgi:type II secretory pathway pseudopilin PulG
MLASLRGFAMLDEIGVGVRVDGNKLRFVAGVRTAWANPDDVAAKVTAITIDDLSSGRGGEAGKAIADAAPSSPFARDFAAGYSGLVVPTAIVGGLAAIAIPAFESYMRRSKQTEATQHLNTLGKDLKLYYGQHHALPAGDAGPTPAVATCCGTHLVGDEVDNRCDSNPSLWTGDQIWGALGFSVDEPTYYRISYHSDGKLFTAKAVGDLDCDGNVAIFEMHGEVADGDVSFKIDPPAPGVY